MPLTRRLAELLGSEEGAQLLAHLQTLGLAATGAAKPTGLPGAAPRLGVWEPARGADGRMELVRDAAQAEAWRFWADVERILPKRAPRVVLLGESVARGYLYDPALTPAALLQEMLPGVDVVDLAASDLTATDLESVLTHLPVLEADALVLFAGNNWHNVLYSLDELQGLAAAVRREGYAACREVMLHDIVAPRSRATMDALAAAAGGRPVVVVVPEFNLVDWRGEPSVLAPVLPQGKNKRWMAARAEAQRALAAGDLDLTAERARELVTLDGGTSAVGYELLGEVERARGRTGEARAALESARDAVCGTLVAHSPRCPRVVQDVLRSKSTEHGFAVVDLPRLLQRELGGDLPDRRLFLDYCHLTARGVAVAMSAVADALAPHLGLTPRHVQPSLAPGDEATAHLLAAVHNAHYGQRPEILRHHLRRAVELSDHACDQLRWYLDVHSRAAEQWLCDSFDRLCESPLVRRYLAATDPRVMDRLVDADLADAMAGALVEAGREPPRRDGDARALDLLARRHHARTFRERSGQSLGPERAYHRALDLASRFVFSWREPAPLSARLTCRLPGGFDEVAEVAVRLNGTLVQRLAAGHAWRTFELELPRAAVRAGANELRVEWPLLEPRWAELIESGARRLERAVYPDVLPAYGEIHALTVSGADRPASPPRSRT